MLKFTTKAGTLAVLAKADTDFNILPQVSFTVDELFDSPENIKLKIDNDLPHDKVIIRSSTIGEDSANESMAGKFLSVPDVDKQDVFAAAEKVAESFGTNGCLYNQILIQPMLQGVEMCGVLFTVCPNTGGNYHVINYDLSGSTNSVTSGTSNEIHTCYVFHGKRIRDTRLDKLCRSAEKLMALFGTCAIDIEFAFTHDGSMYLLQARPLVMKKDIACRQNQEKLLERAHAYIYKNMTPHPYARGRRTIYGVMPDWNPAEMIGIRPRPLASTLYRRLITDGTWAYQRDEYGYRNLRSFPLMLEFCGLPYIDSRVSFNSFIPKDIDDDLADKLANYYLDRLAEEPDKHDKVEFDIVFSCNTFDLLKRLRVLEDFGFTADERDRLRDSLRRLTNGIISQKNGLWITDTEKIGILDKRREKVIESDIDDVSKIYWLLADCTRYGTLPFAGLARAGFVAIQLLKSLVAVGILSETEAHNYLGSLNTVSAQMTTDWGEMQRNAFLKKYGHLRPGTYDITSKRYDDAPEMYLGDQNKYVPPEREKDIFALSVTQYELIQNEMKAQGLEGDVLDLFRFLKAGTEGREYSKFIFTKSLSFVLELLAKIGAEYGFSREDMSYFDIFAIERLYSSTTDMGKVLEASIAEGKARHTETLAVTMPPVILTPDDIYAFHMPSGAPNFITLKSVEGEVASQAASRDGLTGKILVLTAADPGYDWIFSCNVLGFVTAYGGANSHMAIRAGELGIPAVIGIGEKEHGRLRNAKSLRIDCANKRIEVLR